MINFRKIAVGYAVLTAFVVAVEFTVLSFMPLSWWVEYRSMRVIEAPSGGPLEIDSILHRKRVVDMRFSDSLFCDLPHRPNGFRIYSTQFSALNRAEPKDGVSHWAYTADVPEGPAACYVRSSVTVALRYGIRPEPQIITSPIFTIQRN